MTNTLTPLEHIDERSVYEDSHLTKPDKRLAKHLMLLYAREKLNLEDPDGFLARFYENASDDLRAHPFGTVGRDFHELDEVPPQILERIQVLADHRINEARNSTSSGSYNAEMTAFGWLFASGKFEDAWAITNLKKTLKISGWVEPSHMVVEQLATLMPDHPELAVECLAIMSEGDKDGWRIRSWSQHIRTILTIARQSPVSRDLAAELINRLGARGFTQFQDLLHP